MFKNFFIDTEFVEGPQSRFLFWKTKPTIDLISIAVVGDNGAEYYALCKDVNMNEVFNRKDTWVRDNVILPIYQKYVSGDARNMLEFTPSTMRMIFNRYGKSRSEIASDIISLIGDCRPRFYGYYCDYDWVVFCWLFGSMIDLPSHFPMYCIDLKQMMDERAIRIIKSSNMSEDKFDEMIEKIKRHREYPRQVDEHNALDDARFNMSLYFFLKAFT